jgi:DNA invertase Pin-like site-specific DNA recombinase
MTEATKPKAYSYVRFSTPDQARGDSQRRQLEKAKEYAQLHGLELDTELTFRDLGVSAFRGANAATGRLGDFMRAVDEGLVAKGSYLLVESLDRISRSTARKAFRVLEDIIDRGITVVTFSDGRVYDSKNLDSDATNLLISILIFMRGHEESTLKSIRVKASYATKRKAARAGNAEKPFTRRLPAWIGWNEDAKAFELIPERAEVMQEIFELAEAGFGKDAIARSLNAKHVQPFGKAQFWHRSYVEKILSNPACIGTFVPTVREEIEGRLIRKPEEPIKNYFPAVVSEEIFSNQVVLSNTKAPRGRHSNGSISSIFQGLGTCGLCGSSFVRVSKGKYVYLVCSKASAKGGCEYRSIPYCEAENAIRRNIKAIARNVPRGQNTAELEALIAQLEREGMEKQWQLRVLMDEYSRKPSEAFRETIDAQEAEHRELLETLRSKRAERERLASAVILKRIERLETAFAAKPFDKGAANKAMRENIQELRFDPKSGGIQIRWQGGEWAEESIPCGARRFGGDGNLSEDT